MKTEYSGFFLDTKPGDEHIGYLALYMNEAEKKHQGQQHSQRHSREGSVWHPFERVRNYSFPSNHRRSRHHFSLCLRGSNETEWCASKRQLIFFVLAIQNLNLTRPFIKLVVEQTVDHLSCRPSYIWHLKFTLSKFSTLFWQAVMCLDFWYFLLGWFRVQ